MAKTKIDRVLDAIALTPGNKNVHAEFVQFVAPPRNTTNEEILAWLNWRLEQVGEHPFKLYCSDPVLWKSNNAELLQGALARSLNQASGNWQGIDAPTQLQQTLGQLSEVRDKYYNIAKSTNDANGAKIFEKLAARTASVVEAIATTERITNKHEIGLNYAAELATWVLSQAVNDPNCTAKTRDYLRELLDAGMKRIESV